MPITARRKNDASTMLVQNRGESLSFGVSGFVAGANPLLLAYDRDIYVDEVVWRGLGTGTTFVATLKRAASGTAGASGTAMAAAITTAQLATSANFVVAMIEDEATLTQPRVVRRGETLFLDASGTPPTCAIVYVRWHEQAT